MAVEASTGERLAASLPAIPEEQEKRHLLATLPADHAHPVRPQSLAPGRGRASGTPPRSRPLSRGVPSAAAAAPSFSGFLLLSGRLPLPAAGTQPQPAEPAELETRHPTQQCGRGPARRLRPSFRGAPREAATPPRFSGPSSLPALSPPSLPAALHSRRGRGAGTQPGRYWRCCGLSTVR